MKMFLLLLAGGSCLLAHAQTEEQIRSHYQDINRKIKESKEQGYEGSLYCDETVVNRHLRSWPAVGLFQETTQYWYDDDPYHVPANERNPRTVLQKIELTRRSSALSVSEEYLFRHGKLVFYYCREGEEGNLWETRLYFNGKGLFKSIVKVNEKELSAADFKKEEYADWKPEPMKVLQTARDYQATFLKGLH